MNLGGYTLTYVPGHELLEWDRAINRATWRLRLECGHTQKRHYRMVYGLLVIPPLFVRCHECEGKPPRWPR